MHPATDRTGRCRSRALAARFVNRLLDDAQVDVPSGTSVLNGVPVEIRPA